jgi:hypothetical protein
MLMFAKWIFCQDDWPALDVDWGGRETKINVTITMMMMTIIIIFI